ncbi:COG4710 Predicted DNA-binding protein with an HTH domain [Methylophilaceae bacterium]|jgi:RHH-type rel operon transcriptional repressor/antitoxin RelB
MTTSIKLDSEVEKRLEHLVASTGISKDYYLRTFIQNGLADIEDYYLSESVMARVKSGDEKTFDSAQARKFLA